MTPAEKRAREIYKILKRRYPDAHCELDYKNPLQLLMATILSAQCTDKRVNIVTKTLFKRCKTLDDYYRIPQGELEKIIRSAGFFRAKAKSIKGTAAKLLNEFGGEIPKSREELVKLPGVGRKTANVILGNAFNLPGLPVDTHVKRVTKRLGLTKFDDPVKVEAELCELIPAKEWCMFSHVMIFHGRRICFARKPDCPSCPVQKLCPYFRETSGAVANGKK